MHIDIDFKALEQLEVQMAKAPEVVREELLAAMTEADNLILREVKERTPKGAGGASGGLQGSMFNVEKAGDLGVEGFVGSPYNYVEAVELGTKPHAVGYAGLDALYDWVKVKFPGRSERETKGIAYAISWKIYHYGTTGKYMFRDTLAAVEPQVQRIFEAARGRIAERLVGRGAA